MNDIFENIKIGTLIEVKENFYSTKLFPPEGIVQITGISKKYIKNRQNCIYKIEYFSIRNLEIDKIKPNEIYVERTINYFEIEENSMKFFDLNLYFIISIYRISLEII